MAVIDGEKRNLSRNVAQALRQRGIAAEVYPFESRYGKQIGYAESRGIRYVWFPSEDGGSVRDLDSRVQEEADPFSWIPPQ